MYRAAGAWWCLLVFGARPSSAETSNPSLAKLVSILNSVFLPQLPDIIRLQPDSINVPGGALRSCMFGIVVLK
jgi:hypothetical protein